MSTTKKRKPAANKPTAKKSQNQKVDTANRQLKAVILFAVAVFLLFVVFVEGQNIWTFMHNAMFGIFGVTAFFYPLLLGVIAFLYASNKKTSSSIGKTVTFSVLALFVGALVDICIKYDEGITFGAHLAEAYRKGVALKSGGFFGALIGEPINLAFGKTGAIITIVLLVLVLAMVLTGTTVMALFKALARPVKVVSKQAEEAYQYKLDNPEDDKGGKGIKVIKGFNVDIPVDAPSSRRSKKRASLDEMQRKIVDSYYDGDESGAFSADASDEAVDKAIIAARKEAQEDEVQETVDFKKETDEMAENILDNNANAPVSYRYPPVTLLNETSSGNAKALAEEMESTAERLVETLKSFGVETRVVDVSRGPTVTRYELQPRAGVKISKITSLADDIALNLAASGVRIEAPIPNKAAVGIEVPNKASSMVGVREIIESPAFTSSKSKLTVSMGRDIGGNAMVADISKMPHGLIAGATGSGKSVCINSFIISLLYKASPEEVKLLMIDPKVVELGIYNGIPHLLVPVVTEPRKAAGALGWAVEEMEKRYKMFADRGVRDITGYNRVVETLEDEPEITKMPRIVIIIDELADLMMTAPKEVEDSINRIAAKARAAGIHLLIATQRPSVNVVTGVIKANIPTRIAFAVSSHIDSSTILDTAGAEKLLGRGDMLFSPVGSAKPKRLQGCFVSDEEVERVVEFVKNNGSTDYSDDIMMEIERQAAVEKQKKTGIAEDGPEGDPMLDEAIAVVVEQGMASTSLLQRKLKLGYARAARIVDEMEARGVVGPYEGAKPRKVLITKEQLMEKQAGEE